MSDARAPTPPTALARARIQAELAALATWGSPAWWDAVHDDAHLSPGTLVALLRQAVRRGDDATARDLFVDLLSRTEAACARWAQRVTRSTSLVGHAQRVELAEDLRQELTLHLWDQLALRRSEAWETGFWTALDFAGRHVATAYMRRQGLWQRADAAEPQRGPALLLSRLSMTEHPIAAGWLPDAGALDLQAAVAGLPPRERLAVVMRYWHDAREREVALALGITTRAVRSVLARAHARLRTTLTTLD